MFTFKLLLFALFTIAAVTVSWHAFRARHAYGLSRFLGFETLFVLILRNSGYWFRDPFSVPQIFSWTIFLLALALAIHGSYLLRAVGKAQSRGIEETQAIVEVGVYRYIRHPLYASLLIFGWGVFLKRADMTSGVLALVESAFFIATMKYEERFNVEHFGEAYLRYIDRTKMFIPFVF